VWRCLPKAADFVSCSVIAVAGSLDNGLAFTMLFDLAFWCGYSEVYGFLKTEPFSVPYFCTILQILATVWNIVRLLSSGLRIFFSVAVLCRFFGGTWCLQVLGADIYRFLPAACVDIHTYMYTPHTHTHTHARMCLRQDVLHSANHLLAARCLGPELCSLSLYRRENFLFFQRLYS
jgi:hypothetical protein